MDKTREQYFNSRAPTRALESCEEIMAKLPENTLILDVDPFVGFMPNEVRAWLEVHTDEVSLATALAAVHNQVGSLFHELDDSNDPWIIYSFESWRELEEELYESIFNIMAESNRRGNTLYDLNQQGWYFKAKPFMEKNGFIAGAGWWIRDEQVEKRFYENNY